MNAETQTVLEKLQALKMALDNAGASGASGWMRALWSAVQSAERDAIAAETTEAGAARISAEREAKIKAERTFLEGEAQKANKKTR